MLVVFLEQRREEVSGKREKEGQFVSCSRFKVYTFIALLALMVYMRMDG